MNDFDDIPWDEDFIALYHEENTDKDNIEAWNTKYRFNGKVPMNGPVTGRRFMRRIWQRQNSYGQRQTDKANKISK